MKCVPYAALLLFAACAYMSPSPDDSIPGAGAVASRDFGVDRSGRPATLWTLRNDQVEVDVTDHGATLVSVRAPDRAGFPGDIVLGFDSVRGYESDANQYFGCTTGRVCNRIANGVFTLDGYEYVLATNNGPNHLHGGAVRSLDKVHWDGEETRGPGSAPAVRFRYLSVDGEEGFPGNLSVVVTYTLLPRGRLRIDYEARTDRRTPVNLTNHAYWNLGGEGSPTVLDHTLQVDAEYYTPTDDTLIPTGRIERVLGTPLDFTSPIPLGLFIETLAATAAKGYDHNLVLRDDGGALRRVAELRHKPTGRVMTVETTEPGLQVYSGNFLYGQRGKGGKVYGLRSACCLETQHFPDSVHHANFPSTILSPGEVFRSSTVYSFRAE